ncbi:hypothetical protein RLF98_10955 [Flavonifractor plautii]|uniref:Uncharacterized protein n=1 Tax=Flavonifractor plautii TaxID=292800 RepID=A0A174SWX0_FLAPL|nr:hypothetical protein [Flavonifractor plautii]ERI73625.1 hypothetical protein HMPREF0239_02832 [Clostridium sp. ATCC BAA-442]MCB5856721.1 hypothetical protein [Flavonifractor plautii]MDB7881734.1 hypothetical protein [Flavonifractor plautii]MDB7904300.1 hypothetical protein [Flavonifractor plautii]MDB7921999.1 hypothetical protein [Flavonifractor plautii]
MDSLLVMFEACTDSPAYMRLDSEQEAAAAVLSIMGDNPELEELVNAHTYTAKQEGFVNGWAWAQATARECLALRKLPVLVENYGPDRRCGTCGWFVQHYRYTGAYPWFAVVGCGHCTDPETKKGLTRDPVWRGCEHWRPGG